MSAALQTRCERACTQFPRTNYLALRRWVVLGLQTRDCGSADRLRSRSSSSGQGRQDADRLRGDSWRLIVKERPRFRSDVTCHMPPAPSRLTTAQAAEAVFTFTSGPFGWRYAAPIEQLRPARFRGRSSPPTDRQFPTRDSEPMPRIACRHGINRRNSAKDNFAG
jgi:hypothetical protein